MSTSGSAVLMQSLTPNIMVENVSRSIAYYKEVLGFQLITTVPDSGSSFDWAMIQRNDVILMLQSEKSLKEDVEIFKTREPGGGLAFFIQVSDIDRLHLGIESKTDILMEMRTTFYGMKEFAIQDPDGYILLFAEETGTS